MNMDTDEGNCNEHRPCYQNILSFANREENKLTMDELKIITDKMVAQNLIADIGVNGKESFSILEEINISTESISSGMKANIENGGEGIPNITLI